jgi:hypothetical protein
MSQPPHHTYPSRAMNREDLTVYLLALGVPLALLGYGLWRVYLGYVQFGPAAMVVWGQSWFVAAAWTATPLFILTVRAVILAQRAVHIVEPGLIFYGLRLGRGRKTLAWKQIHGIAVEDTRYHLLTLTLRTRRTVRIFPTTGKVIILDDRFHNLPELAEAIKTQLYPHLLPEYRKQWHTQWIYFGPLRINKTYLDTGKRTYPWQQVKSLRLHAGFLIVEIDEHKPLQIPSAKIPNVELLLQLVEELYTEQQ